MGNEPLELWLKNGQVKNANFMDQKVALDLDPDTIQEIRDQPSRVVNGSNFTENLNFTQNVSRMMSQKLELAIRKNDKKVMSRFARSNLIPEDMKQGFYQAVNRPNGLRGMLVRAVNRTNGVFQNLAKKIDKFFDKVNDRVANQKLDKYLSEYQHREFNKAPPVVAAELQRHLDPKLMQMAEAYFKQEYTDKKLEINMNPTAGSHHAQLENEFLKKGVAHGHTIHDSKIALYQIMQNKIDMEQMQVLNVASQDSTKMIAELRGKLEVFELKEASKNETLEDFQTLSKKLNPMDKIDLLVENKAYLALNEAQKQEFEDKHLFNAQEPIQERAEEMKAILEVVQKSPKNETKEIIFERNTSLNFASKNQKEAINATWQKLQIRNRQEQVPTREFMNASAVKFDGVSEKSLQLWAQHAIKNGVDATITAKFVDASLRNAEQLSKAGILKKEASTGEYRFVDNFAKESLYLNLNAPVAYIQKVNQGTQKEIAVNPQEELKERVAQISSPLSFEKLLDQEGNIDSQQLHKFAEHLTQLATQLHQQEKANIVTMEDVKIANNGYAQHQSASMER